MKIILEFNENEGKKKKISSSLIFLKEIRYNFQRS